MTAIRECEECNGSGISPTQFASVCEKCGGGAMIFVRNVGRRT